MSEYERRSSRVVRLRSLPLSQSEFACMDLPFGHHWADHASTEEEAAPPSAVDVARAEDGLSGIQRPCIDDEEMLEVPSLECMPIPGVISNYDFDRTAAHDTASAGTQRVGVDRTGWPATSDDDYRSLPSPNMLRMDQHNDEGIRCAQSAYGRPLWMKPSVEVGASASCSTSGSLYPTHLHGTHQAAFVALRV